MLARAPQRPAMARSGEPLEAALRLEPLQRLLGAPALLQAAKAATGLAGLRGAAASVCGLPPSFRPAQLAGRYVYDEVWPAGPARRAALVAFWLHEPRPMRLAPAFFSHGLPAALLELDKQRKRGAGAGSPKVAALVDQLVDEMLLLDHAYFAAGAPQAPHCVLTLGVDRRFSLATRVALRDGGTFCLAEGTWVIRPPTSHDQDTEDDLDEEAERRRTSREEDRYLAGVSTAMSELPHSSGAVGCGLALTVEEAWTMDDLDGATWARGWARGRTDPWFSWRGCVELGVDARLGLAFHGLGSPLDGAVFAAEHGGIHPRDAVPQALCDLRRAPFAPRPLRKPPHAASLTLHPAWTRRFGELSPLEDPVFFFFEKRGLGDLGRGEPADCREGGRGPDHTKGTLGPEGALGPEDELGPEGGQHHKEDPLGPEGGQHHKEDPLQCGSERGL